jgi:hypothetical protein
MRERFHAQGANSGHQYNTLSNANRVRLDTS